MSLPSEYIIEDVVKSIDDLVVYRADHPIHGAVSVYLPDDTLPPEHARVAKNRLYQNGLQMRNISLLNIPFAAKALEVSQNPNEPYIVTKYAKHDLEELISNGVIVKPRRMFAILSQVLQAMVNLAANGLVIDHIYPRQIKLSQLHTGDVGISIIEGTGQQVNVDETAASVADTKKDKTPTSTVKDTKQSKGAPTSMLSKDARIEGPQKQLRATQRNIYHLGGIAYQLLFGRKYEPSDKLAVTNIGKLAGRWRKILERALSQDIDSRYDKYEIMLRDISRALNRNKRVAIASIPFLLLLVLIASYLGYERYRRHKIMTSEAGQAIESFLQIINETDDEVPELEKPQPPSPAPDEQAILKPFDKIEPVDED
ncbi:MAG: serine/threonine-protein kinase [Planctomycetota bacterium]